MALVGTVTLRGFEKVEKAFRELPLKVSKKILRQALRAGAKPIHAQAKENFPERTGAAKRSIKIRAGKQRKKHAATVWVGTRKGDFKGDEFYAGFIEGGTVERHHKSGKSVGKVVAREPFKRAFEARKAEAEAIIERELVAGIEREAKA